MERHAAACFISAAGIWTQETLADCAMSSATVTLDPARLLLQDLSRQRSLKKAQALLAAAQCASHLGCQRLGLGGAQPPVLLCRQVDAAHAHVKTAHLEGHAAALTQSRGGGVCGVANERCQLAAPCFAGLHRSAEGKASDLLELAEQRSKLQVM